jgi:hypothetical protein
VAGSEPLHSEKQEPRGIYSLLSFPFLGFYLYLIINSSAKSPAKRNGRRLQDTSSLAVAHRLPIFTKKESSGAAAAVQRPELLRVLDLLLDVHLPALVAAERLLAPASQEAKSSTEPTV